MPSRQRLLREDGAVHSYAVRRVNPFLGVLQIIKTSDGRAISANGVVWDIEVRAELGGGWGSLNRTAKEIAYYRYGLWSQESGLVARPLAPHLHDDPLSGQCQSLIECVEQRLEHLPFRLVDYRELWLFDSEDRRPIALLAAVTVDNPLPTPEPREWVSCLGANGTQSQHKFTCARELQEMVKQRAGFNINKRWIDRQQDGGGVDVKDGTHFEADMFPPYLLTMDWPEPEQAQLANDYVEWISPSLLTLQHLNKQERSRFENTLSIQAVSVEYHWRLYPDVIDIDLLNAARVQSVLHQSNKVSQGTL